MERRDTMEQIETLREQASIIRSLAKSFGQPVVRADLLLVAMRCEETAEEAESEIAERRARVIDGSRSTGARRSAARAIFREGRWWALQGLNLRPHPCEGCALPLS
jgi:hypothetical protein